MKRLIDKKGFTLLELLVVIAILGILVTVGLSSFMSSQKKSRDLKRKNDVRQVGLALEAYFNDKGRYPASNASGEILGCAPDDETACPWGDEFKDQNDTVYMVELPSDSVSGMNYTYEAPVNGSSYQLYTRLENTLDSDVPKNGSDLPRAFSDMLCGTASDAYCNYGVSSSNISVDAGRTTIYEE